MKVFIDSLGNVCFMLFVLMIGSLVFVVMMSGIIELILLYLIGMVVLVFCLRWFLSVCRVRVGFVLVGIFLIMMVGVFICVVGIMKRLLVRLFGLRIVMFFLFSMCLMSILLM